MVPQVSPNVEFEDGSSFEIFGGTRTMASENIVLGAEASALFVDGSNVSGTVYLDYIIDTKLSVGIAVENPLVYGVFGFSTAKWTIRYIDRDGSRHWWWIRCRLQIWR